MILYLTPGCFDKGGISRYCRYQIQALRSIFKKGYYISLLGPDDESFEEEFKVNYHGKGNDRVQQIRIALHFIVKAITLRPKIIHVAHVNMSGLAVFVAKLIGAQTVLNVYGLELWSGLRKDALYGLRNVNHIISDCFNTKKYLRDNGIRDDRDITVIWDCVDLEKFKPVTDVQKLNQVKHKYGIVNSGKKIILTLGRIAQEAKHKGYHRLLTVFSKLDQDQFYLVFAGKGNMVDELKEMAQELKLDQNVCFTGMVDEADMATLYSIPDVFSLVSEVGEGMGEGIPLTPLEAMACGTPIIVGNEDGSKEAVFNDRNGLVVESKDLEAHRAAILEATQGNHPRYSTGALEVSKEKFSFKRFLQEHQAFYETIG